MKIVVLGTRGIPDIQGGVETHCQELYPRLVKLGCQVTLFTRKKYANKNLKQFKGVKLIHLPHPKSKSLEAIVHTFIGIIYARFLNPDILHIHAIGPSLMAPLAKLIGLKVVITNHGPDYDRQKWGKLAKRMLLLGERLGTKYANKIIVISNTIKNILETKYNRSDLVLIPNGVTLPQKSKDINYITSLGLRKNKYIIAVGRFVPEKGFHDLIRAYLNLNLDYKLVLVGDADHETEYSLSLKEMAKHNEVILTGFIKGKKLIEIYSHARLFVMPSYHEGLPLALLEAMSYNLNVLVSNIPANKELNLNKGSYFIVGNVPQLRESLSKKLKEHTKINDYSNIIKNNYAWGTIANKTMENYKSLFSRP